MPIAAEWHRAVCEESLQVGELRPMELGGRRVLVGRTEKGYFAVEDKCSHEKLPFSESEDAKGRIVADGLLECPHHGARFDPHTGQVKRFPAVRPITVFETKLEDGYLWIKL